MSRGGKREGAGPPRNNKNGVKSGKYSKDPRFKAQWAALTPEQQAYWLPFVRAAGGAVPPVPEEVSEPSNVVELDRLRIVKSSPLHTHTDTQSNNQPDLSLAVRAGELIATLYGYGFFNASTFVWKHIAGLDVMEGLVVEFRERLASHPEQLAGLTSYGGYLRSEIHMALAIRTGRIVQCPYCGVYRQYVVAEQGG